MKNSQVYIQFSIVLALTISMNSIQLKSLAKTKNYLQSKLILLTDSSSNTSLSNSDSPGTNRGNSSPGARRTPESNCPVTEIPLLAINHNQGSDLTINSNPTLWFYIPYAFNKIRRIEFVLQVKNESFGVFIDKYITNIKLSDKDIKLSDKPGFIKIKIPSEIILEENKQYYWRLNLDCYSDITEEPDLEIDGYIRRVSPNPAMKLINSPNYNNYRENGLWHDAITALAESHFTDPDNQKLTNDWFNLLQDLKLQKIVEYENGGYEKQNLTREELEDLVQKPLVDIELLPPTDK